ncbi:interleukin-17 receptor C [Sphaeramia orbicularis]|uniref:interleukin-17 receptor C n=1 Tax=Sphaeramia orbicularis TaxID=375764 RepID=UPI00117C7E4E|nr:interleukin-17 receptor C-like [Sphaeramia orbicularis]
MAHRDYRPEGTRVSLQVLPLLLLNLFVSAKALEMMDLKPPALMCREGLSDCSMGQAFHYDAGLPKEDAVDVDHWELKVIFCCTNRQRCVPCLQINITVQDVSHLKDASEESGDQNYEDERLGTNGLAEGSGLQSVFPERSASVTVCHSSPYRNIYRTLQFTYSSVAQSTQKPTRELLLTEEVMFGRPFVVRVIGHSNKSYIKNVTIPSLETVCSRNLDGRVEQCDDVPKLRAVTDHKKDIVVLQVDSTDEKQRELMCLKVQNGIPGGDVLEWPKGQREVIISTESVVPCLCFQVWWKEKTLRKQYCPFQNQQAAQERMQRRVSVSMVESPVREGGSVLIWNVTAPCRLEAEVWLCKRDPAGGQCKEIAGSRQTLKNHSHAGWRATRNGHWKSGEFNGSSHPLLCVQMKIRGAHSQLDPHCPFATSRWRWILPLLIGFPLICLSVLGAYLAQGVLKGYVWKCLKEDDVKGAVGGGHVVLLYPPDDEQALPELMCHLGSSLQALGCSVSLDLWSHKELSALGPVPWLHSRLDRLQRQGGKVVLVLTQAAWIKAEEWGARSWERNTPKQREGGMDEKGTGRSYPLSPPCVDVFSASLSCILADYLQGRAGERFMLVQFESLPPEPPGGCRPLPELFRGLHVYSLPSQSLGFLTELAGARKTASASARRKRAGGLRMASRALARGLSGFTAGTTVLRLAGMPQSCVGTGAEDSGETMPLQPCLITPPSSPDIDPKTPKSEMDWV